MDGLGSEYFKEEQGGLGELLGGADSGAAPSMGVGLGKALGWGSFWEAAEPGLLDEAGGRNSLFLELGTIIYTVYYFIT